MKKKLLILCSSFFIFHSAFSQLPVAIFSTVTNPICPGYQTTFTNNSINATSYYWILDGGTPGISTDINPLVGYNTPGQHDVTLIATNANGSDTLTFPNCIIVFPYPPPQGVLISNDTLFAGNPVFESYQWYRNGTAIPGATDYFYVFSLNGDYNIVCIDSNGCAVETVIWDVSLGVQDFQNKNEINIFPNPVSENLYISSPNRIKSTEIKIFNAMGELVLSSQYKKSIDVHAIQPGMYWIEVSSIEKIIRSKFLKN